MVSVEISEVVYELLERLVSRSENHTTVDDFVESVLVEYLKRHDVVGQLHVPLSTMLMNGADSLQAVRTTIGSIDWYETHDSIESALGHMEAAESLLRSTAKKLSSEGK